MLRSRRTYGLYYARIPRAPAQIASYRSCRLLLRRMGVFIQEGLGRHNHSCGAKSTLKCTVINKGLLQWVEFPALGQSFDGINLLTLCLYGQDETGIYCLPIDNHRAASAITFTTSFFSSCQPDIFPQDLEQRSLDIYLNVIRLLIYPE